MEEALAGEIKFAIIAAVGVIFIIGWTITTSVKKVARERTRRELFAYVAEGSISPEQARDLLDADSVDAVRQGIAEAVSIGVVTAKDAESFMKNSKSSAEPASS